MPFLCKFGLSSYDSPSPSAQTSFMEAPLGSADKEGFALCSSCLIALLSVCVQLAFPGCRIKVDLDRCVCESGHFDPRRRLPEDLTVDILFDRSRGSSLPAHYYLF